MKHYPINCAGTTDERRPFKLAVLGVDSHCRAVAYLWCKLHRAEHACRLEQMLASWHEMMADNEQALQVLLATLRSEANKIELELEAVKVEQNG